MKPKKTRLLNSVSARALREVRDRLASAHAAASKRERNRAQLKDKAGELRDEIAKGEASINLLDDEAVAGLERKRAQLRLVDERLEEAADLTALGKVLEDCRHIVGKTSEPLLAGLIREIVRVLAPFSDARQAEQLARESQAVAALENFAACHWRSLNALTAAPKAIADLDELLRGGQPWKNQIEKGTK